MKIITRYLTRSYLAIMSVGLFGFVGLYLVIDFFEKVDDILEKKASFVDAARYFLFKVPFILTQGIPMTALLATLILFGILQRNREIVALKAAGLSLKEYGRPIVIVAVFIAASHFMIGENIARVLSSQAQRIWIEKINHKKKQLEWKHENVWFHGKGVIYQIRVYDQKSQVFQNISLFYLSPQFKLTERLDAARLYWRGNHWIAENGLVLLFKNGEVKQEKFDRRRINLTETPEDFSAIETLPEELGWLQLYRYTKKIEEEGYSAAPYQIELHFRLAFPLTTIILTIMGIAISLRQGLQERIAVSVGVSILVGSLYLAMLQVGTALASAGILAPAVGVWLANVVFGALGLYLWSHTPQ